MFWINNPTNIYLLKSTMMTYLVSLLSKGVYFTPFSPVFIFDLQISICLLRKHISRDCNVFITNFDYIQRIILEFLSLLWKSDSLTSSISDGIYLFKSNYGSTVTICEICSNLTMKSLVQHYWRGSGVFIVNYEEISHIVLVFL